MQLAPDLDAQLTARVQAPDFARWRENVIGAGGCSHPIHLAGQWSVTHKTTGDVLAQRSGRIFAPCGTRRAAVCPSCADRYAADAFHLLRAGLAGDAAKNIPASVASKPRMFLTLTAPSFGPVHRNGGRCPCGGFHRPDDSRLGTAVNLDAYDYEGAILWQANAGKLWHRFTITLKRKLAQAAGFPVSQFTQHARLSYAKVAEYQRRGLVHFHAVIRVDGPDGPADPTPAWATPDLLTEVIATAARSVTVMTCRPGGEVLDLVWGKQIDIRAIRPGNASEVEDGDGEISDARLASYVAKYATKSTGTTQGGDRPLRSQLDIDHLSGITAHHRRMIQTAWDLGGNPLYDGLNLRRWAHMLGFRGHFLTKSRRYSTTFKAIRGTQADYRRSEALDRLGVTEDDVTVINHWQFLAVGYADEAERELAAGIAERIREHRKAKHDKERRDSERAARKENDHA
ncbi:replication initiator [Allokutzneria albata]|uniref:Replication initiation protein n=1 Tax=Allokutzneria albata TaxID=211114 RepID=A0A1H0CB19_ALLAB|nr:replication initiator [Allokutzneria albata]SDN55075.1 hypothetical protein SAMN04489726_7123 [Allokutzneria albata]